MAEEKTALMFAATNGHENVVRILLDRGASNYLTSGVLVRASDLTSEKDHDYFEREMLAEDLEHCSLVYAASNNHVGVLRLVLERVTTSKALRSALIIAAINGHDEIVRILLDTGRLCDSDIEKATKCAGTFGHDTVVQMIVDGLINHDVITILESPGQRNSAKNGVTALICAVYSRNEVNVLRVLEQGASVNECGGLEKSALECAAEIGCEGIVCLLLDRRPNVGNISALACALKYGHNHIAQLILHHEHIQRLLHEESDHLKDEYDRFEEAVWSCGDTKVGKFLISFFMNRGVSVNFVRKNNERALTMASFLWDESAIQQLLDSGVDPDTKSRFSTKSALICAAVKGRLDMVRILLQRGAAVNSTDYPTTPLIEAAKNGDESIMQLLIDHGASLDAQGEDHMCYGSALTHVAMREGAVRFLLQRGASIDIADKMKGRTALMHVSGTRYDTIAQILLQHGANYDAQDKEGKTAIMIAAKRIQSRSIVEMLLKKGASVDLVDNRNQTALIHALKSRNWSIAELLLHRSSSTINASDIDGRSALIIVAEYESWGDFVLLLLKQGALINLQTKKAKLL